MSHTRPWARPQAKVTLLFTGKPEAELLPTSPARAPTRTFWQGGGGNGGCGQWPRGLDASSYTNGGPATLRPQDNTRSKDGLGRVLRRISGRGSQQTGSELVPGSPTQVPTPPAHSPPACPVPSPPSSFMPLGYLLFP